MHFPVFPTHSRQYETKHYGISHQRELSIFGNFLDGGRFNNFMN